MKLTAHTILLVEDDANDVFLIKRALNKSASSAGALQVVSDGETASAYLVGEGVYANRDRYPLPAVILLDLKIPRRSGLELLAWLRGQDQFKFLPVIVLTSSKHLVDMKLAYNLGANSYLVKPVDYETLQAMIKTIVLYWLQMNKHPGLTELS